MYDDITQCIDGRSLALDRRTVSRRDSVGCDIPMDSDTA